MHVIGARIVIALQLLVLSNPLPGQQRLPEPLAVELQRVVELSREAIPIPGIAVGVVMNWEVAYARGFGYADLSTKEPITPNTIFQIGSISKSFTATLAALLVEQGELSWDDPLSKHIPHASLPHQSITLAHLARHTAGLPGDPPTLRRQHGDYPILAFTHFELYRGLAETTLQFQPGSNWGYSNFGYAVLGHALEMKTGTPYEVLVRRRLFEPLEMTSSTITLWPETTERLAKPYFLQEGKLTEYPAPWDE
jgi:CubicO group peptidase (beta-lactamase class C family)